MPPEKQCPRRNRAHIVVHHIHSVVQCNRCNWLIYNGMHASRPPIVRHRLHIHVKVAVLQHLRQIVIARMDAVACRLRRSDCIQNTSIMSEHQRLAISALFDVRRKRPQIVSKQRREKLPVIDDCAVFHDIAEDASGNVLRAKRGGIDHRRFKRDILVAPRPPQRRNVIRILFPQKRPERRNGAWMKIA